MPHTRFIEYFRMSLADFQWLANSLQDSLQLNCMRRGNPLSVEAQVAVGLYRLGHGACYVTIGHVFSIGKETADKASSRFVIAVLENFCLTTVCFPHLNNHEQWDEIKASFEEKHGIPNIVGPIDGTHIPLAMPAEDCWKGYINRKSWSSIVFQCVVDGDGNFCNVSGGAPGSMHNSRLFWRSQLGHSLSPALPATPMIPEGSYLIGDAGYPSNDGCGTCLWEAEELIPDPINRAEGQAPPSKEQHLCVYGPSQSTSKKGITISSSLGQKEQ
ncbi:hypothetical protein PTTG_27193 [Puccinia triticina 1-1 BBBD Race 1]|uniref:DDE Tnp4 domain-containing protein n=1 Tax=Puccinia triticina (isolate 1-1 / race 1 (BBBD)) TaxID=630390 RepID=A0A180GNJ0_PUCT1|nr:hypothetical protein PTTG_27193 [Puccinia triticina 1-1 BBBD Race 1]